AAQAAQGPGRRRPLAQARRARAAAGVDRVEAAHPDPGRTSRAAGRSAGKPRPRRRGKAAPPAGLVRRGRGQRRARAAGVFGAAARLRAGPGLMAKKGTEGIKRMRLIPSVPFLLLGLGAAHAQVDTTRDYLSRLDADRDGRVSLAEY